MFEMRPRSKTLLLNASFIPQRLKAKANKIMWIVNKIEYKRCNLIFPEAQTGIMNRQKYSNQSYT